jgi:hypothetical protein
MKKTISLFLGMAVVAGFLLMPSCKQDPDTNLSDFKYDYYPLDTGKYIVYDVDSIFSYSSDFSRDTAHFQLKELLADTFYDNENRLNYRLEVYRRESSADPWVIDRVWSVIRTTTNLQKKEDEVRYVKLVFPPVAGGTWDGNVYIPSANEPFLDFKNWEYTYQDVDVPYSINGFSFDSALIAVDVADSNFINKRLKKEVYAKGIGMVYQEWEMKTKQSVTSWDTGKWTGFGLHMRMIEHN